MAYRSSGTGRDSYIAGAGARPGRALHDVNARRDNLPDNVFQYLKDQVAREQYEGFVYEQQKANYAAMATAGRGGKRIVASDAGVADEVQRFVDVKKAAERHARIGALYQHEWAQWEAELAQRGLAIDPHSKQ
jgi:hypothetical protein